MKQKLSLFPLFLAAAISAMAGVRFEENRGQAPADVSFVARMPGAHVFFRGSELVFSPHEGETARLRFLGVSAPHWQPQGEVRDTISYFVGQDRSRWVHNAPVYGRLVWPNAYPGIDVVFYEHDGQLEYDLVLAPHADPSPVRLRWSGARASATGEIRAGGIRQGAPRIFQEGRPVAGRFVPAGAAGEFRLALDSYDRNRPLVVDPLLTSASLVGGEDEDEIVAIGIGFVAGNTRSILFPDATPARRRTRDVFVRGTGSTTFAANGTPLLGTVVVGGTGDDEAAAATLVTFGRQVVVYVVGTTRSRDWTSSTNSPYKGGESDGFVAVFSGQQLGTAQSLTFNNFRYIGGSGEDRLHAIAPYRLDFAAAGSTDSPDLPTGDAGSALAGGRDAFLVRPDAQQADGYLYTYLGGAGDDAAYALASASNGAMVVGGETRSPGFPGVTAGSRQGPSDAFLASVAFILAPGTPRETGQTVSTLLVGGSQEDRIDAIACPTFNVPSETGSFITRLSIPNCGFAGTTNSSDLAVNQAAQTRLAGATDLLVGSYDPFNRSLGWLTYWGGSGPETARAAATNWAGDFFIGGVTRSADLATVDPAQPSYAGGDDGLIAVFENNGQIRLSSHYGGTGDDRIQAATIAGDNVVRFAGATTSADLPLTPWEQPPAGVNGFWVNVAANYLVGASELSLPKDGVIFLSLRGSGQPGTGITYRSSDPSKLRLVAAERTAGEVSAQAEQNVRLEGLAEGEVELTATAIDLPVKRIRVRILPSAYVVNTATRVSTWAAPPPPIGVAVRAIDAATGEFLGPITPFNSTFANATVRWSNSDTGVLAIEQNAFGGSQLRPLRAGRTVVSYEFGGARSRPLEIGVEAPDLQLGEIALGENLMTSYAPVFTSLDQPVFRVPRGTMTLRSEDPSRLLIGVNNGRARGTITTGAGVAVQLHGLASSGSTRLIVTSSEFDGERALPVRFDPVAVRVGVSNNTYNDRILAGLGEGTLRADLTTLAPSAPLRGALSLRPGTPPIVLRVQNSDARVLETSRLSLTVGADNFKLRGLTPGTAVLRFTTPAGVSVINPEIPVPVISVNQLNPNVIALPREIVIGRDLQTPVGFRFISPPNQPVARITVDDPSAALVSASATVAGSSQIDVSGPTDSYAFFVQSLKGEGETRIRIRLGDRPEEIVRVILVPSTVGFFPRFDSSATVLTMALEEKTLTFLSGQPPRPGVTVPVRLRVEGPGTVTPAQGTLTQASGTLSISLSGRTQDTVLVVDPPDGFTNAPAANRLSFRTPRVPNVGFAQLSPRTFTTFPGCTPFNVDSSAGTVVRSLQPDRLLLSVSPTATPAAEVQPPANGQIFLHGQVASGVATIRVESPAAPPSEVGVALYPMLAYVSQDGRLDSLQPGQTANFRIYLTTTAVAGQLAPITWNGAEPIRFAMRSSNPAVIRVPESVAARAGETSAVFTGNVVGFGTADVTVETAPPVTVLFSRQIVTVRPPAMLLGFPTAEPISLGNNLQMSIQARPAIASPSGAIARITSSDPARAVVSRSPTALGSASISLALPPNANLLDTFYVQALAAEGEATITISIEGYADTVFRVALRPSYLNLRSDAFGSRRVLSPGGKILIRVEPVADAPPATISGGGFPLNTVSLRPGLGALRANLKAEPAGFLTLPDSVSLGPDGASFEVTAGNQLGEADIVISAEPAFASPPPQVEPFTIAVEESLAIGSNCSDVWILRDTMLTCGVGSETAITVRSEDPSRVVVSGAANEMGRAEIAGAFRSIFLQALGTFGTTEVVISANGREYRIGVALRPSEIVITNRPSNGELVVPRNSTAQLGVGLNTPSFVAYRPGLSIPVDITLTPSGVATVEPTRVNFTGANGSFVLRGVTPGTTVLRLNSPGYPESAASVLAIRVN